MAQAPPVELGPAGPNDRTPAIRVIESPEGLGRVVERKPLRQRMEAWSSTIVPLWLGGVVLLSARLVLAWMGVARLRRSSTRPVSETVIAACRRSGGPAADRPRRARRAVGGGAGAAGGRMAAADRDAAGERADRPVAGAARVDHRARTRAHQAARLSGERPPIGGGGAAVLPPGVLVDLAPDSHRARTLLRRHRRGALRRRRHLRERAGRSGTAPAYGRLRVGGDRRPAAAARAPRHRARVRTPSGRLGGIAGANRAAGCPRGRSAGGGPRRDGRARTSPGADGRPHRAGRRGRAAGPRGRSQLRASGGWCHGTGDGT